MSFRDDVVEVLLDPKIELTYGTFYSQGEDCGCPISELCIRKEIHTREEVREAIKHALEEPKQAFDLTLDVAEYYDIPERTVVSTYEYYDSYVTENAPDIYSISAIVPMALRKGFAETL
ncbi:MAG TPA: hypothetical protein VLG09_02580 [Candidatus Saccharimonadales bacterium]|nr:hypothetical protein [Candidatus Saccharimonadales bacterium]